MESEGIRFVLRNDDINCCKENDLGLGVSLEETHLWQSKRNVLSTRAGN